MNKAPYISIVATTRNDNHGGDLIERTKCFINGIFFQSAKHKVDVELIIVEWNPPAEKALLKDILPEPPEGCGVVVRYIQVPAAIHNTYNFATRIPLFQMTAKNVGIRRATAPFILCTNIDLLFSDELFSFFAKKILDENVFYRANRFDVKKEILDIAGFEDKIIFAKKNVIKKLGKTKGHEYLVRVPEFFFGFKYSIRLLNFLMKKLIVFTNPRENVLLWTLDTFACGDFTLMSKSNWLKIEGYPEMDLYSIHIDSMGIIAATALGIRQEILPTEMCSFHIYHEDGWESFADNPVALIKFMEERPGLDWFTIAETAKWLIKNHRSWKLNTREWGFINEKFKEYIFDPGKPIQEIN